MGRIHFYRFLFLCLYYQITHTNGFTLPFTSFSSQATPRRPSNSTLTSVSNLPSVKRNSLIPQCSNNLERCANEIDSIPSESQGASISCYLPFSDIQSTINPLSSSIGSPSNNCPPSLRVDNSISSTTSLSSVNRLRSECLANNLESIPVNTVLTASGTSPSFKSTLTNTDSASKSSPVAPVSENCNLQQQSNVARPNINTLFANIGRNSVQVPPTKSLNEMNKLLDSSVNFHCNTLPLTEATCKNIPQTQTRLDNLPIASIPDSLNLLPKPLGTVSPNTRSNALSQECSVSPNKTPLKPVSLPQVCQNSPSFMPQINDVPIINSQSPDANILLTNAGNVLPNNFIYKASSTITESPTESISYLPNTRTHSKASELEESKSVSKMNTKLLDLKIMPMLPSPSDKPLQGVVSPMIRNKTSANPASISTPKCVLNKQSVPGLPDIFKTSNTPQPCFQPRMNSTPNLEHSSFFNPTQSSCANTKAQLTNQQSCNTNLLSQPSATNTPRTAINCIPASPSIASEAPLQQLYTKVEVPDLSLSYATMHTPLKYVSPIKTPIDSPIYSSIQYPANIITHLPTVENFSSQSIPSNTPLQAQALPGLASISHVSNTKPSEFSVPAQFNVKMPSYFDNLVPNLYPTCGSSTSQTEKLSCTNLTNLTSVFSESNVIVPNAPCSTMVPMTSDISLMPQRKVLSNVQTSLAQNLSPANSLLNVPPKCTPIPPNNSGPNKQPLSSPVDYLLAQNELNSIKNSGQFLNPPPQKSGASIPNDFSSTVPKYCPVTDTTLPLNDFSFLISPLSLPPLNSDQTLFNRPSPNIPNFSCCNIQSSPIAKPSNSIDMFPPNTISFPTDLRVPDITSSPILSASPIIPTKVSETPTCASDVYLPLSDISSLLQKPFKQVLPMLEAPKICAIETNFQNSIPPPNSDNQPCYSSQQVSPSSSLPIVNSIINNFNPSNSDSLVSPQNPFVPINLVATPNKGCPVVYLEDVLPVLTSESLNLNHSLRRSDVNFSYLPSSEFLYLNAPSCIPNNNPSLSVTNSAESKTISNLDNAPLQITSMQNIQPPSAFTSYGSIPQPNFSNIPSQPMLNYPIPSSIYCLPEVILLPDVDNLPPITQFISTNNVPLIPKTSSVFLDDSSLPVIPITSSFLQSTPDCNTYILVEDILLPENTPIPPIFTSGYQTNIPFNTFYPTSEIVMPISSLPVVSCEYLNSIPVIDTSYVIDPTYNLPITTFSDTSFPGSLVSNMISPISILPKVNFSPNSASSSPVQYEHCNLGCNPTQSLSVSDLATEITNNLLTAALSNLTSMYTKRQDVQDIPLVSLPTKSDSRCKSKSSTRKGNNSKRRSRKTSSRSKQSNTMLTSASEDNPTYIDAPSDSLSAKSLKEITQNFDEPLSVSVLNNSFDSLSGMGLQDCVSNSKDSDLKTRSTIAECDNTEFAAPVNSTNVLDSTSDTAMLASPNITKTIPEDYKNKDFDFKNPEEVVEYIVLKELLTSDVNSNWDLLKKIIDILCSIDD